MAITFFRFLPACRPGSGMPAVTASAAMDRLMGCSAALPRRGSVRDLIGMAAAAWRAILRFPGLSVLDGPAAGGRGRAAMKPLRRRFLRLAAAAAAAPVAARLAGAQAYPTRPVRFIVSFPAGGPNDIVARVIGQYLSDHLGQQFIIENRVGASGNLGMQAALGAAPDGYTIAFVGPNNAISATLYEKLPFDFICDSVPIAGTLRLTNVMAVHPAFPARTLAEFVAHAKANPGKVNFATAGVGTSPHLSGELLKAMTGIDLVHVPYRGTAPALTDLLAGQVPFDNIPGSIGHIRSGKVRA